MVIWSISILIGISVIRVTLFTHILFISLILKSPTSVWVLSFFLRLWVTEKNGKVKGMSIKMNHKGKIMKRLTTTHHLLRFFVKKKKSLHVNTDCSTCYFFLIFLRVSLFFGQVYVLMHHDLEGVTKRCPACSTGTFPKKCQVLYLHVVKVTILSFC